jgi:hypothetical protein
VWLDILFAPFLAAGVESFDTVPGTSGPGSAARVAHSPRIWAMTSGKTRVPTRPACI